MNNQPIEEDETKPLWRYVSKLRKTSSGENNISNVVYVIFHSIDLTLE